MHSLDEKQFVKLFDKHSDAIFRFCFYRLEDKEKAKELAQETFLKTWKVIQAGQEIRYPKAMLYTIARNLVIDYVRRKKEMSLEKIHEESGDQIFFTDEKSLKINDKIDAKLALDKLRDENPEACDIVELKYLHGLKMKEIAVILEISPNSASVKMHRGIKYLKANHA